MAAHEAEDWPAGGIAVVFGAGGGIGSAVLRRLEANADFAGIVAFSRSTEPAIDLLSEDSLAAAARFTATKGEIRLVFDATGFLHDEGQRPEKSWRELDPAAMARAFALNAIGPALIMKHMLPLLPRTGKAVFATLSARVGSIGDNQLGGWYGYRASKAALNQLLRTAAIECRRTRPEAICVALHPGTVETGLSAPFARSGLAVQSPDDCAARLVSLFGQLGPQDNGAFLDYAGAAIPW
ncbi:SDR family NAD(P)-dependent oxidoreductase [Bosea sp. PAMC 26642]|uniref:SDR family NAD(P)-dependent oxidoreductase n=1 Tax=Bosea sp. (strain PAMC 26642) TaxID=1792307 RepID=UPI00076FE5CA|nr:SDR family NAD(P)-dependent oxidoreductase [Bosea sp. PAMC 26642]AMJ61812.1 C-factor [Bosea sp. PAMC 26642]